jgi:hypothetical protein
LKIVRVASKYLSHGAPKPTTMNWYLAKIVYQITCGDGRHSPQFDEQLRLINAGTKEEAFLKAQQTGKAEEETFVNQKEQLVQWQFINVCELYRLSSLIDGAELYSRIEERENAAAYIDIIHKKAAGIVSSDTPEILQLV